MAKGARAKGPKVLDSMSEVKSGSYARDVEHNINAWCSIWEDNNKAKAYRKSWNDIYKLMAQGWGESK